MILHSTGWQRAHTERLGVYDHPARACRTKRWRLGEGRGHRRQGSNDAGLTRSRTFGRRGMRAVCGDDALELTNAHGLLGGDSAEATKHDQHGEGRGAAPAASRTRDESTETIA